jgi:RsiW-degrading membrane proteinase PrsW (M82 family)
MGELGFQFLSVFIAIVIPLLFLTLMIENKAGKTVILYCCWGVFAGALAYNLNMYFSSSTGQWRMIQTVSPLIEELSKGLPLLLFLNRKKYPRIPKLIIYCAFASGIGFSIQESLFHFSLSSQELTDVWMLAVRTLTTSLMHAMTTAAFGIGLFISQKRRNIMIPLIFGLFALCATLHALYNLFLQADFVFVAAFMPLVMFVTGRLFMICADDME